jgi:hypothetical protein
MGQKWDGVRKARIVPQNNLTARQQVHNLLRRFFPGQVAVGPLGAFVVQPRLMMTAVQAAEETTRQAHRDYATERALDMAFEV